MITIKKSVATLVALFSFNTISPTIIQASLWQKTLANGITQKIYFFCDRHQWLAHEPATAHKGIKKNAQDQQDLMCNWAKKLGAVILVEDLFDYEPKTPVLSWLPRMIHGLMQTMSASSYAVTFIANLTERCNKEGIPVVNIEGRQNVHVANEMLVLHMVILGAAARIYADMRIYYPETTPTFSEFVKKYYAYLLGYAGFAALTVANPAYAAYRQYLKYNSAVTDEKFEQDRQKFLEAVQQDELETFGTSSGYFWVVDGAALTYIGNHSEQEIIFVCAGGWHNKNIMEFLSEQGYICVDSIKDQWAYDTNYQFVSNTPLDINSFMQSNNQNLVEYLPFMA